MMSIFREKNGSYRCEAVERDVCRFIPGGLWWKGKEKPGEEWCSCFGKEVWVLLESYTKKL